MHKVTAAFLVGLKLLVVEILLKELVVAHLEHVVREERLLPDFCIALVAVLEGDYFHFPALLEELLEVLFEVLVPVRLTHLEHLHEEAAVIVEIVIVVLDYFFFADVEVADVHRALRELDELAAERHIMFHQIVFGGLLGAGASRT